MSNDLDRTLWVGNLPEKATEDILFELFLQAGPLEKVSIAKERDGRLKSFAFITFTHDVSVPYTIQLMDGLKLYGKPLKLQSRPGSIHQKQQQQQNINQGYVRNPYQNGHPIQMQNQYNNHPMNVMPSNPYMANQSMGNVVSGTNSSPPGFHRSHTWHGSDLSIVQQQQDREERKEHERSRERDRFQNHDSRDRDRDRSDSRRRHERHRAEEQEWEGYRGSPNSYNERNNSSSDFEARRQKVLQKHDRMLQSYRRERDSRSSPSYPSQKRGRY